MSFYAATSDWHGDHVTLGRDRFGELERHADEFTGHCLRRKVDRAFFCGDLCDPDRSPTAFRCVELAQRVALRLLRAGISSHWLAGNHDVFEDGTGRTTLAPLQALADWTRGQTQGPFVFVHERPKVIGLPGGGRVLALPYTASSHPYDPVEWVAGALADARRPLIVLSHLAVAGVQPGEETTDMPRGREVLLPLDMFRGQRRVLILQGHYHRAQDFQPRPDLPVVHVVGAPMRLTFGHEDHEPGFLAAEV